MKVNTTLQDVLEGLLGLKEREREREIKICPQFTHSNATIIVEIKTKFTTTSVCMIHNITVYTNFL